MMTAMSPADLRLGLRLTTRQPLEVQAVEQVVIDAGFQFLIGPESRVANDGSCQSHRIHRVLSYHRSMFQPPLR